MQDSLIYAHDRTLGKDPADNLRILLSSYKCPFPDASDVGIKIHWGERGNRSFLPPVYAREIILWLKSYGYHPFVFDTTVLYSGGRRESAESLKTAAKNGYSEEFLQCPVIVADGPDGRRVVNIPADFKHFKTAQVTSLIENTGAFVIFSHFKGHMGTSFGGAIKNLAMGFASRAQKQRMHADAHPVLNPGKCSQCGLCVEICPVKAAQTGNKKYPVFDLKTCIGCAQCIGMCPEEALRVFWDSDEAVFQEKLVETAAAVWKRIQGRTFLINALLNITKECDCYPGRNPAIAPDHGFIAGLHPVALDEASLKAIGADAFEKAHPGIPWQRQFDYAREIGFC